MSRLNCALLLLIVTGSALAQPKLNLRATPTAYGLYPVIGTEMDRVYARPDAGLSFYNAIHVAPVSIAYRRPANADAPVIDPYKLQEMSLFFRQRIEQRIGGTAYDLARERGLGALTLQAALVDLELGAGAAAGEGSDAYFESIANMTLVIELRDAISGELLIQIAESGEAIRSAADGPVSNREAVIALLDGWAAQVARRLDQVKRLGPLLTE